MSCIRGEVGNLNLIKFLILTAATMTAHAQLSSVPPGFTISASGMFVMMTDSKGPGTDANGDRFDGTTTFDGGFGGTVAAGYRVTPRIRGEIELGYRRAGIDDSTARHELYQPVRASGIDGHVSTLSLMANGIYAHEAGRLRPYVGAGIGIARVGVESDAQTVRLTTAGRSGDVEIPKMSGNDTVFAYQLLAGVGFVLTEKTELRAGYRYLASEDTDIDGEEGTNASHNLEAGVLVTF